MSPKFRLRPQANLISSRSDVHTRGHAVFLPLLMVGVVALTLLLVATTKPTSIVTEQKLSLEVAEVPPILASVTPQKIEVDGISLDVSKLNQFRQVVEEEPSQTSDSFVSDRKLDQVEPLEELQPAIRDKIADSDYLLDSITYSDPERERQTWSKQPSGLPSPRPESSRIVKARPYIPPAASVITPSEPAQEYLMPDPLAVNHCPDFSIFDDHELQITLPGGSRRLKIGDFLNGDRRKVREVGQFLLNELVSGHVLNASGRAHPDVKFHVTSLAGNHSACAVPIIQSASSMDQFTPWMTPQELNHHILSKSCGNAANFWDAGNWMTAVEGRIHQGTEQFRIIHEKVSGNSNFQWVYRVAQTREEFSRKIESQRKNGFRLVQSQMFVDTENVPRFQAVWHR